MQSPSRQGVNGEENSLSSNGNGLEPIDLEKADTASDIQNVDSAGRVSRIQTLTRRRTRFTHPLSHVKTSEVVLVDFDGPDDPYRPLNWPLRKKIVTTLLYGLTTMCSTWASSV